MTSSNLPSRSTTTRNRKSRKRQTKVLEEGLRRNLVAYALAAAGFSAISPEAMAKIVYTPAYRSTLGGMGISLDLNRDGIPDFSISSYDLSGASYLNVFPAVTGNKVISPSSVVSIGAFAAALQPGAYIGPGANFLANANLMAFGYLAFSVGPWANARHHYLGLEFLIGGKLHFGWARLNVGNYGATLTGYAYETIPNRPIQAGLTQPGDDVGMLIPSTLAPQDNTTLQPATLGLLAQGASGLAVWRREDDLFSTNV
jgi:hypothetical protein